MQVHCKKWLATSVGIDLICAVSRDGVKPPCHLLLIYIVKSLIGHTKLVHTPNRLGDSAPSLYSARVDWHSTVSTRLLDWVVSRWRSATRGECWPQSWTIKNPTWDPNVAAIILHSWEISMCGIKGYLHGVEGDCQRTSLWCNRGQKYNRALRKLKNVYQA